MKHIFYLFLFSLFIILSSCSNNDEPESEYSVFMQPASITSTDVNGGNQTFEYDEYGRIVSWTQSLNSTDGIAYSAHFDYMDGNTIKVTSEVDFRTGDKRCFQETIKLINGRASNSEGTFIQEVNGSPYVRKTYRLAFEYDNSNHLTAVKHSEVVGIGAYLKDDAWDNAWSWDNYLIWEDGNLTELQDYQGHTSMYQTTKYEYSLDAVEYPIITPIVINSMHHTPLVMQGIFGLNPVNLIRSTSMFDKDGNLNLSRQYTYQFEDERIIDYTETTSNTLFPDSISYSVHWTETF